VICLVALREISGDDIVGRQVRVLIEEMVLGDPHVFEAGLVGGDHILELVHDDVVLAVGLLVATKSRGVVSG